MNISVITEQLLEDRGITSPEDYLRTLAGVLHRVSKIFSFRGLNTSTAPRSSELHRCLLMKLIAQSIIYSILKGSKF